MTKVSLIWFPCGHLDGLCRLYVESCNSVSSLRGQIWACFLFYLETWGPLSSLSGHPGVIIFFVWTPGICLDKLDVSTISTLSTQTPGSWSLSSLCGCGVINISTGTESLHSLCGRLGLSSLHNHLGVMILHADTWESLPFLPGHLEFVFVSTWTPRSQSSSLHRHLGVLIISIWTPGSHYGLYVHIWESYCHIPGHLRVTNGSTFCYHLYTWESFWCCFKCFFI